MDRQPFTATKKRAIRAGPLLVSLLLLALVGAVFSGARSHGFITLDDQVYLVENPRVFAGLTWPGAGWALTTTHAGNWHPLTWVSHMLDVEVFGMDAGGHHFVNVALHGANAILLLLVLSRLSGALWRSALVAALFAVHPLHVESVAWISERKDVLSTLLWLLTLALYLRHVRRPRAGSLAAALATYALSLAAKPMPVTLPFLLLLLDWWPLARWGCGVGGDAGCREFPPSLPPARLWREKLPFFALAAASAGVTYFAQLHSGVMVGALTLTVGTRLANALTSYAGYLVKALWPADLSVFYPHPAVLPPPAVVAGVALALAAATFAAFGTRCRRPWLLTGWLWYLGTLVPVLGLVQVGFQAMADRYTYVPLIGIFLAITWELGGAVRRRPSLRLPAALGALAVLASCTAAARHQFGFWRDNRTLFEHARELDPGNYVAHFILGVDAMKRGELEDARLSYEAALRAKPDLEHAHVNLAVVLAAQGRFEKALEHVRAGLRLYPWSFEGNSLLGELMIRKGRPEEAIAALQSALQAAPASAAIRNRLGIALALAGRYDEAVVEFGAALRAEPGFFDARFNLAKALASRGSFGEALPHLESYLVEAPNDVVALVELGDVCLALGRRREAERAFRRALALDPSLTGSSRCPEGGEPWCGLLGDRTSPQRPGAGAQE